MNAVSQQRVTDASEVTKSVWPIQQSIDANRGNLTLLILWDSGLDSRIHNGISAVIRPAAGAQLKRRSKRLLLQVFQNVTLRVFLSFRNGHSGHHGKFPGLAQGDPQDMNSLGCRQLAHISVRCCA